MFGIMADIFLLAAFFLLDFAIFVFSLYIFLSAHISSFAFSNTFIILDLYKNILIKRKVL